MLKFGVNNLGIIASIIVFQFNLSIFAQSTVETISSKKATAATNDVDYSPDGKMIATYTKDESIALWDTNTGKLIKKWRGQEGYISELDWSPDGKYLASASTKGDVVIWNKNTTERIVTLEGGLNSGYGSAPYNGVNEIEFSPNGQFIAAMRYYPKGEIVIWRISDFSEVFRLKRPAKTNDIGWSADGNAIYSIGETGELRKWSLPDGRMILNTKLDDKRLVDMDGTRQNIITAGGSGDLIVVYDILSFIVLIKERVSIEPLYLPK